MPKLPALTGNELIHVLEALGFRVTRQKGSHVRLFSADGRAITVPIHENKTLPKGLLRKIIREDMEMSMEDFLHVYQQDK